MAGEILTFYTVEKDDLLYVSSGKWTSKDHDCARMDEDTATRVARRYPGATCEKGYGYDFAFRSFEDLEPDAGQLLRNAVTLCKRDGMSIETLLLVAEKSFRTAKDRL